MTKIINESLSLWVVDGNLITPHHMSPTTKRESYQQTKHNGSSEAQQERIMFCLREHPQGLSNQELETILKMRISSITARINELRKQGLVECGGAKINKDTERLNATWRMKI